MLPFPEHPKHDHLSRCDSKFLSLATVQHVKELSGDAREPRPGIDSGGGLSDDSSCNGQGLLGNVRTTLLRRCCLGFLDCAARMNRKDEFQGAPYSVRAERNLGQNLHDFCLEPCWRHVGFNQGIEGRKEVPR